MSTKYTRIVCLLFSVIPFIIVDMPHGLAYPAGIISLIASGILFFKYKQPIIWSKPTAYFIGAVLVLLGISLTWSVYFETSLKHITKMGLLLPPQIVLLSLINSLPTEHLKKYAHYISYSIIGASAFLCFEIISGGFVFNLMRGNPLNIPADPDEFNSAAVVLSILSFPSYALLNQKFNDIKIAMLSFIPIIIALYFTHSQSAQLCFIAGLIIWFAFPYRSKLTWTALKFTLPLLVIIAPFVMPYLYVHAAALQDIGFLARGYAGHRLEVWDYISRYALQEPLHGYGVRATRMIKDFDTGGIFWPDAEILHPHNFAVQLWLEFGVIGAALGASALFFFVHKVKITYTPAQQKIILPTFIATLVPMSLAYSLWQGWWIGALFYICAVTSLTIKNK